MIKSFGYTIKQALIQFVRNFNMSAISIFAITCMMLILSLFFIVVINVNMAAETIKGDYDSIEIFLEDDTSKEDAEAIMGDLRDQEGVDDVLYKSKEQAMKEFKSRWGDNGYLLDSLSDNPLPNSIVIIISDLDRADTIAKTAGDYEGVEDVKFYKNTVDKLLQVTDFIQLSAIIIMVFLIVVSIIVVSNTIKLTVFNRADEISIMRYVGATNWFIRGPFLVEGIIIGVISSAIAIGITAGVYYKLVQILGDQVYSMLSMPLVPVGFLVYNFAWIFLALGISIGSCGSIISMRRFLDA